MYNHRLETFIQAADAGSFAKAAEALYISSTAVMKQINLLESSLEVRLFNRTPRGLTLMLMKRNWSRSVDLLRDELWAEHPEIQSFYSLEVFNQCEHENALLMAAPQWEGVHPLLKILPVDWNHSNPLRTAARAEAFANRAGPDGNNCSGYGGAAAWRLIPAVRTCGRKCPPGKCPDRRTGCT